MKLNSITLQNFRCFEELQINLHPQLTVLVANNGGGKTSILRAIAILLSDYITAFPLKNLSYIGIVKSDLRKIITDKKLYTNESALSTVITAIGNVSAIKPPELYLKEEYPIKTREQTLKEQGVFVEFTDKTTGEKLQPPSSLAYVAEKYHKDILNQKSFELPLIAYYDAERVWRQTEEKWRDIQSARSAINNDNNFLSRIAAYGDCLDAGDSYTSFFDWFQYIAKAHADQRNTLIEKYAEKALTMQTNYGLIIETIREAVNSCLESTGWSNISYSHIHQSIMLEHPAFGMMELNQLSDGIRNTAALIADIALRAVRLNKHLKTKACQKTQGIVLIDEIDLHLHPSWQQKILPVLCQTFPKIQFIISTHSPAILSTVKKENIREIKVDYTTGKCSADEPLVRSYGESIADTLETIMDVSARPDNALVRNINDYLNWAENGDLSKNRNQQRDDLEKELGKDHSDLAMADLIIRRREILAGIK